MINDVKLDAKKNEVLINIDAAAPEYTRVHLLAYQFLPTCYTDQLSQIRY